MKQHTKKGNQFSMLHGTGRKKNWELIEQLYKCTTKQRTNAFLLQVIWLKCMWEKSIPEPKLKWISKYADHHFATTQFILNAWTLLIFWLRVNLCVCVWLFFTRFAKLQAIFLHVDGCSIRIFVHFFCGADADAIYTAACQSSINVVSCQCQRLQLMSTNHTE